jgi:hypothetical protein
MRKMNVTLSALSGVAAIAWAGSAAALNPQPEPPMQRLQNVKLHNLQTLPPGPCVTAQTAAMDKHQSERMRTGQLNEASLSCAHNGANPGTHQLNPQPLPPG